MARAWTLISIMEGRQYGGNLGYEDDLRTRYSYDSSVANHLRVRRGDLVFLRNSQTVFGIARIEEIESSRGVKIRLRCPECRTSAIRERKRRKLKWRCKKGHTFAHPTRENVDVTQFKATYENTFIDLQDKLSVRDLKLAALRPNDQMSIEEINAAPLGGKLNSVGSAAYDLLLQHLQAIGFDEDDSLHWETPDPVDAQDSYTPKLGDNRKQILGSIRLRRGQRKFRKSLIRRYGPACLISGCRLLDVVEASHIWPYRSDRDNHPENGLLLRADLHILFDLNLLGIDPEQWTVQFHPKARSEGYSKFEDRRLRIGTSSGPSTAALRSRWNSFLLHHQSHQ